MARMATALSICAATVLVLGGAIVALASREVPMPAVAVPTLQVDFRETAQPGRQVYRHSVIPGGVYSPEELRDALGIDSVAAEHHRSIALNSVRAETVPSPRLVYMSYRIGDDIAWTKHKVLLPAGETILTDGINEVRARCGNGISAEPMEPTSDREPDHADLDAFGASTAQTTHALLGVGTTPTLLNSALIGPWIAANGPSGAIDPEPIGSINGGLAPPWGMASWATIPGEPIASRGITPWIDSGRIYDEGDPSWPDVPTDEGFDQIDDDGVPPFGDPGFPRGDVAPPPPTSLLDNPELIPTVDDPGVGGPNTPGFSPGPLELPDPQDPSDPADLTAVPEPGTIFLVASGAVAALLRASRRRR